MSQVFQYVESVASRLSKAGFALRRGVQSDKYLFDVVVLPPPPQVYRGYTRNELVVVAGRLDLVSSEQAADFSSFVMKYVLDNKHEFGVGGGDLCTISIMVAEVFNDE